MIYLDDKICHYHFPGIGLNREKSLSINGFVYFTVFGIIIALIEVGRGTWLRVQGKRQREKIQVQPLTPCLSVDCRFAFILPADYF